MEIRYTTGFGNFIDTEARPGALPRGQSSPQQSPLGLYPEQINGTAFTAPRSENQRSWVYRIRPSVIQSAFEPMSDSGFCNPTPRGPTNPTQYRWNPIPDPTGKTDWLQSLQRWVVAPGHCAVSLYAFNANMDKSFFYNADAEMIFIPQKGTLTLRTEFGILEVPPLFIAVIPRGVKFQVQTKDALARGYVGENDGAAFRLPGLGPIGANGLANPRDFETPLAAYEEKEGPFELVCKFDGGLWKARLGHSPLDVVAWHGNLAPYRYDLRKFQTIGTISYDHPDPSIFTVLTSPSDTPGTANIDFVIFPPRWMVAEHTFRPPYYHRNIMSEYMGLIEGVYDAKETGGFVPGGGSLHNRFSAHGPDAEVFKKASQTELKPHKIDNTMAFMLECRAAYQPTERALRGQELQSDYLNCWQGLPKLFRG